MTTDNTKTTANLASELQVSRRQAREFLKGLPPLVQRTSRGSGKWLLDDKEYATVVAACTGGAAPTGVRIRDTALDLAPLFTILVVAAVVLVAVKSWSLSPPSSFYGLGFGLSLGAFVPLIGVFNALRSTASWKGMHRWSRNLSVVGVGLIASVLVFALVITLRVLMAGDDSYASVLRSNYDVLLLLQLPLAISAGASVVAVSNRA